MTDTASTSTRSSLADSVILVIDDNDGGADGARYSDVPSRRARRGRRDRRWRGLPCSSREPVDLVIQDMNFRREATSGEEGMQLFHEIRKRHDDVPIILLTAWTHLETAIELVKAGAADYIAKPWDDARLLTTVRNLLDLRRARAESTRMQAQRRQARRALARAFRSARARYTKAKRCTPWSPWRRRLRMRTCPC